MQVGAGSWAVGRQTTSVVGLGAAAAGGGRRREKGAGVRHEEAVSSTLQERITPLSASSALNTYIMCMPYAVCRIPYAICRTSYVCRTHRMPYVRLQERVAELEREALADKSWHLVGEVTGQHRPMNSALELDMEFENTGGLWWWWACVLACMWVGCGWGVRGCWPRGVRWSWTWSSRTLAGGEGRMCISVG